MNGKWLLAALAAAAAVILAAVAMAVPTSGDQLPRSAPTKQWPKLTSPLAAVLEAERASGRGLAVARSSGLRVVGGRVRVVVETQGARPVARQAVVRAGGVVEAVHANLVQALVAPAALAALAKSSVVVYVRAPRAPLTTG